MRKRNKICFSIFIFIFSILFTSLSIKAATFNEEELGEPELSIDYYNLSHSSEIYIAYAVKASGFDAETNEVKMLFWDEYQTEGYDKGTESYLSSSIGTTTINDNNYYVFYSRGLAAKQLTDQVYCRAYVIIDGIAYYSDVIKYSAIKYATDLLLDDDTSNENRNLVQKLLEYGAAAQVRFNYHTDRLATDQYYQVSLTNAILFDGFSEGIYKYGTEINAIAVVPDGYIFVNWIDSSNQIIGTDLELSIEVTENLSFEAVLIEDDGECKHENIIIDERVEPTCTEEGLTQGSHCGDCGKILIPQQIIEAIGHSYSELIVEPTCTEEGYTLHTCTNCGDTYKDNFVDSLGHEYGDWIEEVPATCTEDGIKGHYHCERCNFNFDFNYQELDDLSIIALGHEYGDWIEEVPATCTEDGIKGHHHCERCDLYFDFNYQIIDDLTIATIDHDYSEEKVNAFGVTRGYTIYTCNNCGDSWIGNYDYSLYDGMSFTTTNRFLIPYNFKSSQYTIEASINVPTSFSDRAGVIVGNYGSESCLNFEVYYSGQIRLYVISNNEIYDYYFSTDVRSDKVVNIALTLQRGYACLYLDGVLVETKILDDFEIPVLGRKWTIGGDIRPGNSEFFKGTLYSLSIFNDVRTENEILSDCILAEATDDNCCVSYNILNQDTLTNGVPSDNFEYAQVTNVLELEYYASIGTRLIEVMNDFELDRTIYIVGDVTLYSNGDYILTRSSNFNGDLFVIGSNTYGRNLVLDNIMCKLSLGKSDATGSLTIDGNKDNLKVDVVGAAFYIIYSGTLNMYDNITITNHKKVGNLRILKDYVELSTANYAGGAGVLNVNGTFNMYGGTISNCEINTSDLANGDETATNYMVSTYGSAVYSYSNFNMYGGTIDNNVSYRGAIYQYYLTHIYAGTISNNYSYTHGGAIYSASTAAQSLYIGSSESSENKVRLINNTAVSNGGAIYGSSNVGVVIYGNVVFEGNQAKNGGAICMLGAIQVSETEFINNYASSNGGAVYISYSVTSEYSRHSNSFTNVVFEDNQAKNGGALGSSAGIVLLSNCYFINNTSTSTGGAIYLTYNSELVGTIADINNSIFEGNSSNEGGAINALRNSNLTITGATEFRGNSSTDNGGTISLHAASLTCESPEVIFENNSAAGNGGSIYISYATDLEIDTIKYDSTVTLSNATFTNNNAKSGGAIYALAYNTDSTVLVAKNNVFESNTANSGGAIYFRSCIALLNNNVYNNNLSISNGGSLYLNTSQVIISGDLIKNSTAVNGGGIYSTSNSTLTVKDNTQFESNSASDCGGAIYCSATIINVDDAIFKNNQSVTNGGSISLYTNSICTITRMVAYGNSSVSYGGVLYVNRSTLDINGIDDSVIFGTLNSEEVAIRANTSKIGGVLYATVDGYAEIDGAIFGYNVSTNTSTTNGSFGGGAIAGASNSSIIVSNSTFVGNNAARYGGAVAAGATSTITLESCIFNNNTSSVYGGAIYSISTSEVTLIDCTFDNNSATSGGVLYFDAFADSAGNVTYSKLNANNCLFTSNTANKGGVIYSLQLCEIEFNYCEFNNNIANSTGGAIEVHGSIIEINNSSLTGNESLTSNGGGLYISYTTAGSYSSIVTVNNSSFEQNVGFDMGGAIYQTAISYSDNILTVNDSTFTNNNASKGGGAYLGKGNANFSDTVFTSNFVSENNNGGAVHLGASVFNFENCDFINNTAYSGGAINTSLSILNLSKGTTFDGNVATDCGGAIYSSGSTINIDDVIFMNNQSVTNGGAVSLYSNSTCTVTNISAYGNKLANFGGVFYVNKSTLNINGTDDSVIFGTLDSEEAEIKANSAKVGGAIYATTSAIVNIDNAHFGYNVSTTTSSTEGTVGGGAIAGASNSSITILNSTFDGNNAAKYGGAVGTGATSTMTLDNCTFNGNTTSSYGGAIYSVVSSQVTITACTFNNNKASIGGAIYGLGSSVIAISGCEFSQNNASSAGGAIYVKEQNVLSINDSVFNNNESGTHGGALYLYTDGTTQTVIENCGFNSNIAASNGGAIYNSSNNDLVITSCEFINNHSNAGGLIYGASNSKLRINSMNISGNTSSEGSVIYGTTSNVSIIIVQTGVIDNDNEVINWNDLVKGGAVITYE